ncbi:MAG: N-acetylmuramoyl-L-alanine amidase [Lachnospiraceae bacterium]|nr:N-acetylmuramoyl-L-alanine amidase [Lachnospiraceae bacterium]
MKKAAGILLFLVLCISMSISVKAAQTVVVVIDPGHGGAGLDDAENGAHYKDDLAEKDVDLLTALAMKQELEKYNNVEVYLTREDDRKISLEERVDFARSVGADVMVSCHYNASESHLFYGSEIFTSAFGNCYATGNGLAQCIMKQWMDDGLVSKGIKVRIGNNGNDYYGVIRHGCEIGLPVIIIEHGYLDNHIDYERLGMREDWERMGRLDAAGVAGYYGLSMDTVYDEVGPTVFVEAPQGGMEPDLTAPEGVSLEITDLNIDTGEVTYEVKASEPDGRLMYYGLVLGNPDEALPEDYADLLLWEDGRSRMSGTYSVPTGYRGKITARVYNCYELYTDSLSEDIDMAALLEERADLLEEEARKAEAKAQETRERKEAAAAKKKAEEDMAKEREEVGDFSFLLGGRGGSLGAADRDNKSLLVLIIIFIILTVVLICILIFNMRKKITKYISDRERDESDRY